MSLNAPNPTRPAARGLRPLAACAALLLAAPAWAHHAMDGRTPETLAEGLLSGLAHPVIGLDHLAFVLAVGWLLAKLPLARRAGLAAAFVVGTVAGTFLHLQSVDIPASELLVALSVLLAGLSLVFRRWPGLAVLAPALPLAGLLHGYAYGESIVGAEPAPLAAYLAGFAAIQFLIIVGVATLLSRSDAPRLQVSGRAAGIVIAGVGAWFSMGHLAA